MRRVLGDGREVVGLLEYFAYFLLAFCWENVRGGGRGRLVAHPWMSGIIL